MIRSILLSLTFILCSLELVAQQSQAKLWYVEGNGGVFNVVRASDSAILYSNTGGFEDLDADDDDTVYALEDAPGGGWQVVRIPQSGAPVVLYATAPGVELCAMDHYGDQVYVLNDSGDLLRIPSSTPTTTPSFIANIPWEVEEMTSGDGGYLYLITIVSDVTQVIEVSPWGALRTLAISSGGDYSLITASCHELIVLEDLDPAHDLIRMSDPSQAMPAFGSAFYANPLGGVQALTSDCRGRSYVVLEDWQGPGLHSIERIGPNGNVQNLHTGLPTTSLGPIAVNDGNAFHINVSSTQSRDLRLAFESIPNSATAGGILVSFDTSAALEQGPFYGLTPDTLTNALVARLAQPPAPGDLFFSLPAPSGVFPDAALQLPAGAMLPFAGQSSDFLGFVVGPNLGQGQGYQLSEILRINW